MSGEQLTPREAALWARTRRETLHDLEVDFQRYLKTAEGQRDVVDLEVGLDLEGARWAHGIVSAALVRLGRITGELADELPAAPCSIPGVFIQGRPWLLCGYPAGHAGQHAWAQLPPERQAGPWWRRR
jgi:hypothetical protein